MSTKLNISDSVTVEPNFAAMPKVPLVVLLVNAYMSQDLWDKI